ncbi:Hydrogenase transcriptional regulatory protein hupR1 [Fundidesulfovibrio magnetotacticus]|uniref:Hydrogenase transcriptional regulatory protein hupR1 n=1 Tax=Fundidesulfovibrio magnetotacticus TaxID=2730080 RepID=A0A6V8LPT3_9BACT|nr:hybrid sensor histidine kinase/response regulator [Fundidesulfovibrio magnetotacticus]GFK93000.1 Hydrogenase transcriptional regulatory protein hupR1 [Fundidesulfovibrio magnetotacticus]
MNRRILYVDDEQEALDAFKVKYRRPFEIVTALGPEAGLEILRASAPFAVIVSDLRMPVTDGMAFLTAAGVLCPDSVRMMLTGCADLDSALKSINNGLVFRFLEKPCPGEMMVQALLDGLEEYARRVAVRLERRAESLLRHDLRGPLVGVSALSGMLLGDENLSPELSGLLEPIHQAGIKALTLLDAASALRRIEDGDYVSEPVAVDIPAALNKAIAEQGDLARAKALAFDISFAGDTWDATAVCDRLLLGCILRNLLKNACEASPHGGVVEVSLSRGQHLSVGIANLGEVPREARENFFEKFTSHGKRFGAGLGAYAARTMARAMGGDVFLDCSLPGRTSVLVMAPVSGGRSLPGRAEAQ